MTDATRVPAMACAKPTAKYPDGRAGTPAGYQAHRQAGETPCGTCRKGVAAAAKTWTRTERRTSQQRAGERALWRKAALERDPMRDRRGWLRNKFNMTLEDYDRMLAEQDGKCAVCRTTAPGGRYGTFFLIDHDHDCCPGNKSCGKCVRSLLCHKCNIGIGQFDDDPDRLMAAVAYLLARRNLLQTGRR